MEYMLSFKHTAATRGSDQYKKRPLHPDCHTSEKLQRVLRDFHGELKRHCGCVDSGTLVGQRLEDMGLREKLERMLELVMAGEEEEERRRGEGVTTLQQLITRTMLQWASSEVKDLELVGQIFVTKWELTQWELTKWEIDQMGIDEVGIGKVGIDKVGRYHDHKAQYRSKGKAHDS